MRKQLLFAAALMCSASLAQAALITTQTGSGTTPTKDGALGTDEYGVGNSQVYTGGGAGFGGTLGAGSIYMENDATNLYVAFDPGNDLNDVVGIWLNTQAGGFADSDMSDSGDGSRIVLSDLTLSVDDVFSSGTTSLPDYGLTIGDFGTVLFELNAGSTANHLNFVAFDGTFTTNNPTLVREVVIPLADIGATAGDTIEWFAAYGAGSGFASNESIPVQGFNAGNNLGTDNDGTSLPVNHDNFNSFVTLAVSPAPSSTVTVDVNDASPDNVTTFNSLMAAINSFQTSGAANVNGGITTDGSGVGVNSAEAGPHTINIATNDAIDEIMRIDDRAGAIGHAVHGTPLVINGPGAVGSVAVAPSLADNALLFCQDETGIADDDGFEIRSDIDITFNNITFVPSPTAPAGDELISIDRSSAATTATANTITFNSCVITTLDALNVPVVSDKLGALVDNTANIATPGTAMDKGVAFFPDAGESMNVVFNDSIISHTADNDGFLDLGPNYAAGDGANITFASSIISYNGVSGSRYGIQMSGSDENQTLTITGSNVAQGPIAGLGGPSVLLGNPRAIQSFYGPENGQLNIDNTIIANNSMRQLSLDAEVQLTMDNSLVYGPVPFVITNNATNVAKNITNSTIVAVGGSVLIGDDATSGAAINFTDSVLASSDGTAPLGGFGAADATVNLNFVGVGAISSGALTNLNEVSGVFGGDPGFVSVDPTSADFLDVQNTDYAGADSVAGDLGGGADYVGGAAPASVSINSAAINFGAVDTANTSDDTTSVSLDNSGGVGGYVSLAVSGTDAAEFSTAPAGVAIVPASGSLPVTVTFAPLTVGAKTAQIDITGGAAGTVALDGIGQSASVSDWNMLDN